MKKIMLLLFAFAMFSFRAQEVQGEKFITIKCSVNEVKLMYKALGKLPAEESHLLMSKLEYETERQLSDTTKNK